FVLLYTDPAAEPAPSASSEEDAWILSRMAGSTEDVLRHLADYDFAAAVKALYAFIWNDLCDVYVEAAKGRLYGEDAEAKRQVSETLLWVLERTVAIVHPIMPFVTEEIWGFLPGEHGLLPDSPMPAPDTSHRDPGLEERALHDMDIVSEARHLAGEGEQPVVTVGDRFLFAGLLERVRGVTIERDPSLARAT